MVTLNANGNHMTMLTLSAPSNHKVGSSPTEKIRRRMVEMIRVRIPAGRGTVITIANDTSMAVHTSPDSRGSSSEAYKQKSHELRWFSMSRT